MRDSQPPEKVRTRDRDASDCCSHDQDVRLSICALVCLRYGYVCASKTMALRRLLEAANSNTGFTNQEKGVCVCVCLCLSGFLPVNVIRQRNAVMLFFCSVHQILKSSSTSFSSSSESSHSSRSGNLTQTPYTLIHCHTGRWLLIPFPSIKESHRIQITERESLKRDDSVVSRHCFFSSVSERLLRPLSCLSDR